MKSRLQSLARLSPLLLLAACAHQPPLHVKPATPAPAAATGYVARTEVQQFVDAVVQKDGFDRTWVEHAIHGAHRRQAVIDAITKPYEAKPWYQYEPLFVTDPRIDGGVAFWNRENTYLQKAEAEYGVPAEVIVAIVGVESFYGRQHGGYPVIDSLTTLAFDYPPRAAFFQGELEQFLILCREQSLDPLVPMGSYAGAMGAPQFMPDSFRQYAVDFDADGKRDIWGDWADIIGSVANYFHLHGWQQNGLIVVPAALQNGAAEPTPLQPTTVGALRAAHITLSAGVPDDAEAVLVALQGEHEIHYWVGLHNFRVITQYNKSPLYAMAVVQLASAVVERRAAESRFGPYGP
ncbi:MAG TPA: lytic murein transglycosylase B [Gammaproteobacteria bacterium]|nr:lytic murein transglycosylase B [Gammaproteobacteria bacterium]